MEIINREKKETFRKGNGQNLSYELINIWEAHKKLSNNEKLISISLFSSYNNRYYLFPLNCLSCNDGVIVIPENPQTFDYSYEGFVFPYCNMCGVVFNE